MAAVATHVEMKTAIQNKPEIAQDSTLLDTFWRLAEPNDSERLKGASDLLEILLRKQKQHVKSGATTLYCSDVEYCLKRLVTGLASGRKGARLGYVTVLAELLEKVPRISLDTIFKLIQENLVAVKGKKEEKDLIFGQVFAYLAIIQSGRLQRSDEQYTVTVLQNLFTLGERKSYLLEICFQAIIDVISKTSENVFIDYVWPKLKPKLKLGWDSCSAETLALLSICHNRFPDVVKSKFVQSHWGHSNLLDESNLHHIAQIMVKSTIISHPNVHFGCEMILAKAMQDKTKLPLFWQRVVDDGLCGARQECKFLALKLLERVLPICDAKLVKAIFSKTLIRVFINSLSNRQGFLHKASVQFSENLPTIVSKMTDGKAQVAVIQCLLTSPGHILFDDITKSRTVQSLVSSLCSDGVRLYFRWLKKLFVSGTAHIRLDQDADIDMDRKWVCMQILSLIRNPKLPHEDDWMREAAQFLLLHSFFRVTSPDPTIDGCDHVLQEPVSETLRKQIWPFVYSAVGSLSHSSHGSTGNSAAGANGGEHRSLGTTSDGQLWVHVLARYSHQLLHSAKIQSTVNFDKQAMESWDKMIATVEKLRKKIQKKSGMSSGLPFQLLFLHVGLQMLSEPKQSIEILEDLHSCNERALQRRKSAKKNDEEEPDWVVVVTEILLSLLSKSSHLLRTVVDNVFKMVCPHINKEALGLLLNVLDPTAGASVTNLEVADDSDQELLDDEVKQQEAEEEEDEDEDSDEDEETKGSKKKKKKRRKVPAKMDEEDDSDDSEDEDEEEEEEEEVAKGDVDEVLRANIRAALGGAAKDSDEDEGEESDDQFDDDTMIKIDGLLEKVFQQHRTSSMTRKEMDNAMLHFKLRVLDLIEIFLKRQQDSPLILDLVEPLLELGKVAAGKKDNQVLADKAFRIFRNKLCALKKYPHNISDQKEFIHQTIDNLMQLALKGNSVQIVALASAGCLFLMKILRGNVEMSEPSPLQTRRQRSGKKRAKDEENQPKATQTGLLDEDRIAQLYVTALDDFMTRKGTCLHPVLFLDLIERFPMISWSLVEPLVKYVTEGVQLYRKTQACHLLSMLLSRRPFMGESKRWSKLSKSLLIRIQETLKTVQESDKEVKPNFLIHLTALVKEFAKLSYHVKQTLDFSMVTSALEELKKKPKVKKSKDLVSAISSARAAITNKTDSASGSLRKKGQKKKKKNRTARMRELKKRRAEAAQN